VEVHALTTPDYDFVLASRHVTGRVMPGIRTAPQVWLEELRELGGGGGVLLTGSDAACEWLTTYRADVPASLLSFETVGGAHVALMDKYRLHRIATAAGVRTPWTFEVTGRARLAGLLDRLAYPCVLKPTLGHLAKELVGAGTVRIGSPAELVGHGGRLLDHGLEFVVTELVPGAETALEGAVVVRDRNGDYPLEYGRRKVRQFPLDYGVGSLTEAADVPETVKICRRLLDWTGYVGVAACETKRHADTGELYLIEVNVRLPGSFGMAQACGIDGAWRLYATLAGLPLGPQREQVDGRKVLLPQKEVRAAYRRIRRGDASLREILASWRGTRDFGAIDLRDPRPALALAGRLAAKALGRTERAGDVPDVVADARPSGTGRRRVATRPGPVVPAALCEPAPAGAATRRRPIAPCARERDDLPRERRARPDAERRRTAASS
jgi:D-aspartate ligase